MNETNDPNSLSGRPWRGSFICGRESHADRPRPAPYFRREFDVGAGLRGAVLSVTALGVIESYLNGFVVGDEVLCPGWTSYRHRIVVSSHDVTALLQEGRNAIGAVVGEGWAVGRLGWEGKRCHWSDRPAAYLQLELDYDGWTEVVATNETWRTATGAVLEDGIYDGETYDARRAPTGWANPGFNDGQWQEASRFEWDLGTLERRTSPPIRRIEELPAKALLTTPSGKTVADFGQVLSGWIRLTVNGPAGHTVTLRHCELLVGGEPEFETNRMAMATDRYVLAGRGQETWEPRFTFHGFRYVEVEGWPGELAPEALTAVVVHSDLERTGWFETSDDLLNQLHRNVTWSFRGNAVGVPTDCPQRDERLGWTGDINAFAPTAAFLFDVKGFLGSWLRDLAAEQQAIGAVPMVVPDVFHLGPMPPTALWGDVAVSLPWTLFMEYGDLEALRGQYPSMKAFIESVEAKLDKSGLWTKGFQFGDWLDPDAPPTQPSKGKTEAALVANAYLCRALGHLVAADEALDYGNDRSRFQALRDRVLSAFRNEWLAPSGRLANETQTSYALAVAFDLLESGEEERAGQRLNELVVDSEYQVRTGFAGTPWLLPALSRTGHHDTAFRLLTRTDCPSFLYPVTQGATTIWERWDAVLPDGSLNSTGMTSLNHYAFGAVADWMHRVVGGIHTITPAYRRVRIAPQPGGALTYARAVHDTVQGRIAVQWRTVEQERSVQVQIPPGVTAEIVLPGHPVGLVESVDTGLHQWAYAVPPDRTGTYDLDTPFSLLKADETVWQRVVDALQRVHPAAGDYVKHIDHQFTSLRQVVENRSTSDALEDELRAALRGTGVRDDT